MGKIQKSLYYYNSITTMGSYHDRIQEEKGFLSGWLFLLFIAPNVSSQQVY